MADTTAPGATYDDKSQALESSASYVKMWISALNQAEAEEKDYLKKAEETANVFRGKMKSKGKHFNIFHSNIETICPALYNSTPSPDVRRRYADPDPVAKVVADIVERSLSYSIDSYDFDAVMKAVVRDGEVVGRGVPRVRYVPTLGPAQVQATQADDAAEGAGEPVTGTATAGATAPQAPQEELIYQEATCEYVPWRYFRRGPARTWNDVPWIAFGDFLTREELQKLCGNALDRNGKSVAEEVPLNYTADHKDGQRKAGAQEESIFRRALVWQFWDKDNRKVVSICPDYKDAPLAMVDDPLGLRDFFPTPRPYQPILATDSLVPVIPYEIYEDLVDELNEITRRIAKLVKQLRPRALYGGDANDIKAVAEGDDGDLIPATKVELFLQQGGLEKALAFWPLDPIVKALSQLVAQRAEIKQVIYEVTGTSDILRGATDASETATAQQIKAQWGSLRIQDRQSEVARVARDLMRLKAAIIASKFSFETLEEMTGIRPPEKAERDQARQMIAAFEQQKQVFQAQRQAAPPGIGHNGGPDLGQPEMAPAAIPPMAEPQPPSDEIIATAKAVSREEVEQVLRSDLTRGYRIDIESDSTIRGDLTRNQQTMNLFLQGTAQFAQAMGPLVTINPELMQPAIEVYTAFARQFKLGKQAEDALDALADKARQGAAQPKEAKPDPKAEAVKAEAEAKIKTIGLEAQRDERKHIQEMARMDRQEQIDQQKWQREQPQIIELPQFPFNTNAPAGPPGGTI